MDNTNVERVWHEGRQWTNVTSAAKAVGLSEAAIYKAVYEERLEARFILGVKAIALDSLFKLWPESTAKPSASSSLAGRRQ